LRRGLKLVVERLERMNRGLRNEPIPPGARLRQRLTTRSYFRGPHQAPASAVNAPSRVRTDRNERGLTVEEPRPG